MISYSGIWNRGEENTAENNTINNPTLVTTTIDVTTNRMGGMKPPKNLSIDSELDMSQEWNEWLEMHENYFIAVEIDKEAAPIQTATFINALGRDVLKVINNF